MKLVAEKVSTAAISPMVNELEKEVELKKSPPEAVTSGEFVCAFTKLKSNEKTRSVVKWILFFTGSKIIF